MSNLFFRCEWIIRPLNYQSLNVIMEKLESLDCILRVDRILGFGKNDDGYWIQRFSICVPSEDKLLDFQAWSKGKFDVMNFEQISEEEFEQSIWLDSPRMRAWLIEGTQLWSEKNNEH